MSFGYKHLKKVTKQDFTALLEACNYFNQIGGTAMVAVGIHEDAGETITAFVLYNDVDVLFSLAYYFGVFAEHNRKGGSK